MKSRVLTQTALHMNTPSLRISLLSFSQWAG